MQDISQTLWILESEIAFYIPTIATHILQPAGLGR